MRMLVRAVLAGVALATAVAGPTGGPAHAATAPVTLSSPCYQPDYGRDWVYWTVTNATAEDVTASLTNDTAAPTFTVPAHGSVVRETLGGHHVELRVSGTVVDTATVDPANLTPCGLDATMFQLTVECRLSPYQVRLRIRNATDRGHQYRLVKQRGEELAGTALPGNTWITEDWVAATDRWKLTVAGFDYVRVVGETPPCPGSTPSATPTTAPTVTPAPTTTPTPVEPSPTSTGPVGGPTGTAPVDPTGGTDPTLTPLSHAAGRASGGVLLGGLAALVVGSAVGTLAVRRRRTDRR